MGGIKGSAILAQPWSRKGGPPPPKNPALAIAPRGRWEAALAVPMIARIVRSPRSAAAARALSTAVRATAADGPSTALNAPLSETDPELFDIIEHEKRRLPHLQVRILQRMGRARVSPLRRPIPQSTTPHPPPSLPSPPLHLPHSVQLLLQRILAPPQGAGCRQVHHRRLQHHQAPRRLDLRVRRGGDGDAHVGPVNRLQVLQGFGSTGKPGKTTPRRTNQWKSRCQPSRCTRRGPQRRHHP